MPKPIFATARCKGCYLCTVPCPKKILGISDSFNIKGYKPAVCTDASSCIGCALCAKACPDMVIEIHK